MIEDKFVTLAYGNGGVFMRALIDKIFARHLANPQLDVTADAVYVPMQPGEVMITTDGFTVHPLEFPGGRYWFACRTWNGQRSGGRRRNPGLSDPQCFHRRGNGVFPTGSTD